MDKPSYCVTLFNAVCQHISGVFAVIVFMCVHMLHVLSVEPMFPYTS